MEIMELPTDCSWLLWVGLCAMCVEKENERNEESDRKTVWESERNKVRQRERERVRETVIVRKREKGGGGGAVSPGDEHGSQLLSCWNFISWERSKSYQTSQWRERSLPPEPVRRAKWKAMNRTQDTVAHWLSRTHMWRTMRETMVRQGLISSLGQKICFV